MTTQTGEMTLEDAAAKLAGNWQHFDSFCWHGRHEVESPEGCAIIYTHTIATAESWTRATLA